MLNRKDTENKLNIYSGVNRFCKATEIYHKFMEMEKHLLRKPAIESARVQDNDIMIHNFV